MYLILLGAPGAGKGTQGEILAKRVGIPKVATGDLLRAAVRDGTPLGQQAKRYMDDGLLVPDDVILGLIEEKLTEAKEAGGVIMDGFPRTIAQAEAVDALLAAHGAAIDAVVTFDVGDEELVRRMLGRAEEQGRSDDTPDAIRRRLEVYREQTAPLIEYYDGRGLVRRVDAMGNIDEIAGRVAEAVD